MTAGLRLIPVTLGKFTVTISPGLNKFILFRAELGSILQREDSEIPPILFTPDATGLHNSHIGLSQILQDECGQA